MRVENIISSPVKTTYKYGVYGTFGFCAIALGAFVIWSISCIGGAAVQLISSAM